MRIFDVIAQILTQVEKICRQDFFFFDVWLEGINFFKVKSLV